MPVYICDLLTPYEPDLCLRSSSRALLMVPKSRLVTKGDRAFGVRAPKPVVLSPRPVTNPNTPHHAEQNKKITFSFTIHFSFYIN